MKALGTWVRLKRALTQYGVDGFIREVKTYVIPLLMFLYFIKKYKDKFLRRTKSDLYRNEIIQQLDYIIVFRDKRLYLLTPYGFLNIRHKRKGRLSKGLKNVC